ncbi:DNA-binding response regulator [Rubrobacter tropicus]|uniref:DNA-binding response regulator n=2 Tax=Rubrobacter tropicus TaxID=2653851 RepID=A0A6G8QF28_9ACTN|nr:DNA-binding response regulator [Rubrobacter tropicus]
MARAGLRSMLEAVEGADVRVSGDSGAPAGSLPGTPLAAAEVVLLADEELLDETALALAEDGAQGLVLLSEDERAAARLRALPLRGWGILPPDAPPEELGAAVAAAAHGLVVMPKAAAEQALGEVTVVEELSEPPTAREGEVLNLLARGLSNKMIARELRISEHTVKFHISSLYAKLAVSNRAEAVSQGARHGLISL